MTTQEHLISEVMDTMPYGLYIVGSAGESGPNGMMADWVGQVSFKPRLIALAIENDAHTLANIRATRFFSVNFLSESREGMNVARRFASPYLGSKIGGPMATGVHPKLAAEAYDLSGRGSPILRAALAWLECEAREFVAAGDHTLVIGQVVDGHLNSDAPPLTSTYTGWTYSG